MATLVETKPVSLERSIVILKELLAEHAAYRSRGYQHAKTEERSVTLFDSLQNRYALVDLGWFDKKHSCKTVILVELLDGKLWIQQDDTEEGIADELVKTGIDSQHIVLGYRPEEMRSLTGFAVK